MVPGAQLNFRLRGGTSAPRTTVDTCPCQDEMQECAVLRLHLPKLTELPCSCSVVKKCSLCAEAGGKFCDAVTGVPYCYAANSTYGCDGGGRPRFDCKCSV